MAIDHGLQGNNTERSRRRRSLKAKRTKAIARGAINKKGEVLFNEQSREEYLTGFRKRKMERRKFGVAMQILKDKKATKDKAKERRQALKETIAAADGKDGAEEEDDDAEESDGGDDNDVGEDEENGNGGGSEPVVVFEDPATRNMFGGTVSVVVDGDSLSQQLEQFANPDKFPASVRAKPPPPSRKLQHQLQLQRAMKQAKKAIHERKSSKRKMDRNREKVRPTAQGSAAVGGRKGGKKSGKR